MNKFSKYFSALIIFLVFISISFFYLKKDDSFEVLKVVDASEFFVDFNRNKVCDEDEHIILYDLKFKDTGLSTIDNLRLSYLSNLYAKKVLFGQKIKVYKTQNNKMKFILADESDYESNLIKYGYVITDSNLDVVKKNIEFAKSLNLVKYNKKSKKVHKLDCKYSSDSPYIEIIKASDVPSDSKICKYCHISSKKEKDHFIVYPKDVYEKYNPIYKDAFVEFYVTDFTKYYYPSNKCLTTACQSLLKEIKNAKRTIDFAIYGIDSQPEITNALITAQNRGVRIRWIYDVDKKGYTIYSENFKLKKILKNCRSDVEYNENLKNNPDFSFSDSIMHNKFFIFDSKRVWTGSANISRTDLSGFNANSVILIDSAQIAKIYENEFEQMYNGYFHKSKQKTEINKNYLGNSDIEVYFSPQDAVIKNRLIDIINSSKKYVYVPVFVVTHNDFNEALINAKKRGVDVRIIVDATFANNRYSSVKKLRANKIKVKAENRAGKMHMKSMIVDDKYTIVGSMNFSKSGESYNDENVLIIKNIELSKNFRTSFLYFWNTIPEKWFYKNPASESFNSINSCFDGIDNDFDGKIDKNDEGCNFKKKSQPLKK